MKSIPMMIVVALVAVVIVAVIGKLIEQWTGWDVNLPGALGGAVGVLAVIWIAKRGGGKGTKAGQGDDSGG